MMKRVIKINLPYLTLAVLYELQGRENMWEKACYVYNCTKGTFRFLSGEQEFEMAPLLWRLLIFISVQ